ncbi:aminotransferase class V-fold PLP-dependent enzyme [Thermocatellispora tengchongensis]|uniref:aminotransferase class V-fold PLP-dependent enzyme n=1 Tax=Thermocatellispora tengchongensis TaxID=1073253 RepID=UPI0036417C8D
MTTHLTDLAHLPMHRIHHLWDAEPGWLDTASYGLPPRHAHTELTRVLDQWRRGSTDWTPWEDYTHRARHAFATLVAAPPTDITIGATASQLLSMLAAALPPGTTVLAPEIEFTSNLFPWAVSATLRTVPPDHLAESIDASTGVVAFSLVQSATGQIAPAADIIAAARHHGALVVADASQACGWLPIDATRFDVLVCAAYKWLMSPRGAAYAYLSPRAREHMRPIAANWYAGADPGGSYYGPRCAWPPTPAPSTCHPPGSARPAPPPPSKPSTPSASTASTPTTPPWPPASRPPWANSPPAAPSSPSRSPTPAAAWPPREYAPPYAPARSAPPSTSTPPTQTSTWP